ncbi:hypothetical protein D3C75_1258880 [compost metagenome]
MQRFNVYFFSDWPENLGERVDVYVNKEFSNEQDALTAATTQYHNVEFFRRGSLKCQSSRLSL